MTHENCNVANAPVPLKLMCNKCKVGRDINDFGFLKNGNRKKLCSRHEKTRPVATERAKDDWDTFIAELKAWNDPVSL